jgi:hypothetical protein
VIHVLFAIGEGIVRGLIIAIALFALWKLFGLAVVPSPEELRERYPKPDEPFDQERIA